MFDTVEELIFFIESQSNNFSKSQKIVANYFIKNYQTIENISIDEISKQLFVSKATISRFSQKLGFSGFKEFKYILINTYKNELINHTQNNSLNSMFLNDYNQMLLLLNKIFNSSDINTFIKLFTTSKKIYTIGIYTSGLAAEEFAIRFAQLGFNIQSISDAHFMQTQAQHMSNKNLLICFSLTGETNDIINTLKIAKKNHTKIVLITEYSSSIAAKYADLIFITPPKKNLTLNYAISNQLPQLFITDLLYFHVFNSNIKKYTDLYKKSIEHETQK